MTREKLKTLIRDGMEDVLGYFENYTCPAELQEDRTFTSYEMDAIDLYELEMYLEEELDCVVDIVGENFSLHEDISTITIGDFIDVLEVCLEEKI